MDPKLTLLHMAQRLYTDIHFVTEQNPTQIVDEDGARSYNNLLNKAQKFFPHEEFLEDFTSWAPRTIKYKDALVVAGQFTALVETLTNGQRPRVNQQPGPSLAPPQPVEAGNSAAEEDFTPIPDQKAEGTAGDQSAEREKGSGGRHDEELYGPNPIRRNKDGTIPFSLD